MQLRKTVEMEGGFYYARYNLALALELKESVSEAIAQYQRAIALNDAPYHWHGSVTFDARVRPKSRLQDYRGAGGCRESKKPYS